MNSMLILAAVLAFALLILTFVALHYIRAAKRAKLKSKPLLPTQIEVLRSHPSWQLFSEQEKEKWQQHVKVFLNEKNIWDSQTQRPLELIGQTELAASACLPLINRKTNYYGHISDIYYNPKSQSCTNAAEEEIEWIEILYAQFCQEISGQSMTKNEFVKNSKIFLKGELDSLELRKFYKLNLPSSST